MRPFSSFEQLTLMSHFLTRFEQVRRFPYQDQAQISAYQFAQLRQLVEIAYTYTPFYRYKYDQAGITPADLRSWDDLPYLPTVTKDEVIAAGPAMIDCRRRPDQLFISRSSGSSGKFVTLYLDSHNFIKQALQTIRMLKEYYPGYHPSDLELLVYTSEYPVRSLGGAYRVHYIHNLEPHERIFEAIRRLKPAIVAIYPSILREIALNYGDACAKLGLKLIITNSEHAGQEERDHLAQIFACPVFDEYSSEELSSIAQQCFYNHYHLVQDCSVIELLQPQRDQAVGPDEWGEIVGTCLINRAMPIIRYRQGDLAMLSSGSCRCGKTAPFFAEFAGRKNASFKRSNAPAIPSGRILDWSYDLVLKLQLDLREFQITQLSLSQVRITLVPGVQYSAECDSPAVARSFTETFGQDFNVSVELVPVISKTRAGKHIPIQSLVDLQPDLTREQGHEQ